MTYREMLDALESAQVLIHRIESQTLMDGDGNSHATFTIEWWEPGPEPVAQ